MEVLFFKNQKELESWFEKNYKTKLETWVGYYKKHTKKESITWDESVEEALKFGWIDGLRKSIDEQSYKIRFTPRKVNSNWSLKNIKTIEKLIEQGLVREKGLEIYEKRKEKKSGVYAFEQRDVALSVDYLDEFKKNEKAWNYFKNEKPYYKKTAVYWVMSAKKEETRQRRLKALIEDSANEIKIKQLRK